MTSLLVLVATTIFKALCFMSFAIGTCLVRLCRLSKWFLFNITLSFCSVISAAYFSTISASSSIEGYPTLIFSKNLSACASGNGYVPSCSMGFCVAKTKNGRSSLNVLFPTVTCFSCIASSKALCVFGVALLISSARTMFANTGPGWNLNCLFPEVSSII